MKLFRCDQTGEEFTSDAGMITLKGLNCIGHGDITLPGGSEKHFKDRAAFIEWMKDEMNEANLNAGENSRTFTPRKAHFGRIDDSQPFPT